MTVPYAYIVEIESTSMPNTVHIVPVIANDAPGAIAAAEERYREDDSIPAGVKATYQVLSVERAFQWNITEADDDE